jgi:hypothetical protein
VVVVVVVSCGRLVGEGWLLRRLVVATCDMMSLMREVMMQRDPTSNMEKVSRFASGVTHFELALCFKGQA